MILAKVTGCVISNQKSDDLRGGTLLLINEIDQNENIREQSYVAVDKVGAGQNDIVLVGEYYSNEQDVYQGMTIVAIVESIQRYGN